MPATQEDVALRAGVARKTVSNVINGYPHVSPDVRARVLRAIEELNYRPSHAARSLRSGRSSIIGLAVPELDVPYFAELGRLIVEQADEQGITVMIMQTRGERERELALLNGDHTQIVDGMIYSPVSLHGSDLQVRRSRIPLVLLGERSSDGLIDHVGIDNVAAARLATQHLLELGRRRVAFIGAQSTAGSEMASQRCNGYRQALVAAGQPLDDSLIVETSAYHRADGHAAVTELLRRSSDRPDGIFCATDLLAQGAVRGLMDAGVRIPDDVAVIGFDDLDEGRFSTPSLSTISPDKRQIAAAAVARILDRGLDPDRPPSDTVTNFRLIARESTIGKERAASSGDSSRTGARSRPRRQAARAPL